MVIVHGPPPTVTGLPAPPPLELYSPGALFTWPELQAMASDGVLTQLYQRGYLPPGSRATPQLRARAAADPRSSGHPAAGRRGKDDGGVDLRLRRRTGPARPARGRQPADFQPAGPPGAARFHEVRLGPFDVVSLGGLMVSSPLRTAVDIALHVDAERAMPALRALLGQPELGVRLRLLRLAVEATPRMPHKRAALAKLEHLRAGPAP